MIAPTWLAVFCFSSLFCFLGFALGAVLVWSRLHRLARVSYAAGRLDERNWRQRVATYEEKRPLSLVRGGHE